MAIVCSYQSGTLFKSSRESVSIVPPAARQHENFHNSPSNVFTHVASWQQWSKKLDAKRAALLVMNNDDMTQTITVNFSEMPIFEHTGFTKWSLRDVWAHVDVGTVSDGWTVTLESHDSAFLVVDAVA